MNNEQPAGRRLSLVAKCQRLVGDVLRRLWPESPLWWDVSTFSLRGLRCYTCGRLSWVERTHLQHRCEHLWGP